jgi:hypothetical protein
MRRNLLPTTQKAPEVKPSGAERPSNCGRATRPRSSCFGSLAVVRASLRRAYAKPLRSAYIHQREAEVPSAYFASPVESYRADHREP